MKKKTIILIFLACAIVFVLLCSLCYVMLSKYSKNVEEKAFVDGALDFLKYDESFESQYGDVFSLQPATNSSLRKNEYENKTEYYMLFNCETENAIFNVYVFHVYEHIWSYRYEVLVESIEWK